MIHQVKKTTFRTWDIPAAYGKNSVMAALPVSEHWVLSPFSICVCGPEGCTRFTTGLSVKVQTVVIPD